MIHPAAVATASYIRFPRTDRKALALGALALSCSLAVLSGAALAEDAEGPTPAVSLQATYTGELGANTTGGIKHGEKYLDNLDLTATIDAEQVFNIPGGTLFIYGLYNNNHTLSDTLVGDLQAVSNIDSSRTTRLYEAWYEQKIGSGESSLKFGLFDLNSEFDAIDTAGLFLSSSHGIGPDFSQTGQNGPSIFPNTSLAARLQLQISDDVLFRTAILDGAPGSPAHPKGTAIKLGNGDGALLVGELEADLNGTTTAIGAWGYTAKFDDLLDIDPKTRLPRQRGGNIGAYIEAERQITAPSNDERGLSVFGRFGVAQSEINQLGSYIGMGASYHGPLDARPDDLLGIALAQARNGGAFRKAAGGGVDKAETSIELTYRAELTPWLAIQPDAQVVFNPGTDPSLKNAVVVGLRFEIGFGQDF